MDQEQRDSYFIPPDFIEGGSLLGGIFKTRNVVEAGILAVTVGVPVLQLNISLTARIIILCLTALPLALFALIGVSRNSLKQFIVLFFSYLANHRILNQDSVSKIAPVNMQFKVLTKRADINRHLEAVRRELASETDERCRQLQEDYLQLIQRLGSREAITRRFFLVFEYEPLPGAKRGQEKTEAVASLQTAARTVSNYLRQCGNDVIFSGDEDEASAEILYNILCRRASAERPFPQKAKEVLAEYMVSGREIDTIPYNEFYAPSHIDFTHGHYICIDGVYDIYK